MICNTKQKYNLKATLKKYKTPQVTPRFVCSIKLFMEKRGLEEFWKGYNLAIVVITEQRAHPLINLVVELSPNANKRVAPKICSIYITAH